MYIVTLESVYGGHSRSTETTVKMFDTKEKLTEYLSTMAKTANKIRVFEATEMNFDVSVKLTPLVKDQTREENGSFTKGYYD